MKRYLVAVALMLPLAAFAEHRDSMEDRHHVTQDTVDYARVLSATPIYGSPVARQVCHPVSVNRPVEHNTAGSIIGGLAGALVGSRFGGGHGQDAATVAGAIGGAIVGDRMGSGEATVEREACNTVYEKGEPTGYRVAFEYHGEQSTVMLDHAPGEYVKVRKVVTVE